MKSKRKYTWSQQKGQIFELQLQHLKSLQTSLKVEQSRAYLYIQYTK